MRQREEEAQEITTVAFQAYSSSMVMVTKFKYLGCVLTASDNNWMVVVANIWKAWRKLARFLMIFGREGAETVHAKLLFGS